MAAITLTPESIKAYNLKADNVNIAEITVKDENGIETVKSVSVSKSDPKGLISYIFNLVIGSLLAFATAFTSLFFSCGKEFFAGSTEITFATDLLSKAKVEEFIGANQPVETK